MTEEELDPPRKPTRTAPDREFDIAVVGTVGLPARYGGFETLAEHLVSQLSNSCRILVFCSRTDAEQTPATYRGARLEYLAWRANGWQSTIYDALAMLRAMWRTRVLLVLGVSGALALPMVRLLAPRTRIVTNIDGIEWRRRKWGAVARGLLRLSEAIAVRFSHSVIADNKGIQEYVRSQYRADSTMIPYGGDSPTTTLRSAASQRSTRFAPHRYYLSICRIEPENNIAEILEAFSLSPSLSLVLVGNWGVSPFSRSLRAQHSNAPNIELLDPIYEPAALQQLRDEAVAYVHGHSAGGTNPSLVEAMHAGLAVLAFDVNYNRHTMRGAGFYWGSTLGLIDLLSRVRPDQLAAESSRLKQCALQHYTWERVCAQYAQLLLPA